MGKKINVLIASRYDEDKKCILAALEDHEFFIVGIEKDEAGIIIKSEQLKPDVLILDMQLSMINYPQLIRIIRRRSPSTAIIILTETDEDRFVFLTINAGVSGFLLKEEDINKLVLVVKIVYLGGCYINTSITSRVFKEVSTLNYFHKQAAEHNHMVFSSVERGILTALANGMSDNQIAKHLNYSEGSIKNILTEIKRRTKFKNRIQIVANALLFGLIHFEHLSVWSEKRRGALRNSTSAPQSQRPLIH